MTPRFAGFSQEALTFLRELKANNEAEWFKPRKAIYEEKVKAPLATLLAAIIDGALERKLPLTGDPIRSVFRIHRDIRFSRDKRPYKPNAGATLTRSGQRHDPGLLYLHIEPGRCFLACGFWQPPQGLLDAWRKAMLVRPRKFLSLARALDKKGLQLGGGEIRKKLPRGFEAAEGTAVAPYMLWNSFIVNQPMADEETMSPQLPDKALDFAQSCRPLLDYGWALAG